MISRLLLALLVCATLAAGPAGCDLSCPGELPARLSALVAPAPGAESGGPLRVLPLGDSLTYGLGGLPGGYRTKLAEMLTAEGHDLVFVGPEAGQDGHHHAGRNGRRATELLREAERIVREARPDFVLLLIGTNDARQTERPTTRIVEDIAAVAALVRQAAPEALLLIGTLPPVAAPEVAPRVREINDLLTGRDGPFAAGGALAREGVRLVPIGASLAIEDLPDGLHPSPEGYAKIALAWAAALRPSLATRRAGAPETTR